MKIYIFADMEGISGISYSAMVSTSDGSSEYQLGRKYLTAEINNCVQACFDAGADEVVVRDGHGMGCNVLWSEIKHDIELVQGYSLNKRFAGIEGSDGVILLGYHAMAGTPEAVLEHTYTSKQIQNMWLNGGLVGEFGIDSAIAGDMGIPVIMTSGCDKLCAEAEAFYPGVVTCQVKRSISGQGAILLAPSQARKLVYDKTVEAVTLLKEGRMKPLKVSKPVTIRREYVERMDPGYGLSAPRTVEHTADTVEEAFFAK